MATCQKWHRHGFLGLKKTMSCKLIERLFPRLKPGNYRITSSATRNYNCIAWAAGCTTRWWWPSLDCYWPQDVPREQTVSAFLLAFKTLGYEKCNDGALEPGHEKVALFVAPYDVLKHMARQLDDGWWTSKLGRSCDIEHKEIDDVSGERYGKVFCFMRRRKA